VKSLVLGSPTIINQITPIVHELDMDVVPVFEDGIDGFIGNSHGMKDIKLALLDCRLKNLENAYVYLRKFEQLPIAFLINNHTDWGRITAMEPDGFVDCGYGEQVVKSYLTSVLRIVSRNARCRN
jgi:hypothetical protein